jgi:transcriptional regulator with XRE-family HTH domain
MTEDGPTAQLRSARDVKWRALEHPAVRAEWERSAPSRALALRLVAYRAARDWSQAELARAIGVKQPQVARWEAAEGMPTFATPIRLSERLGMAFHVDITPDAATRDAYVLQSDPVVEEGVTEQGSRLLMSVA